jgi:hypothetical protein
MNNPNFQQNPMAPRPSTGLQNFIQHYRSQLQQQKIPPGWQQSVQPEERGQLCLQFFTQYRLLKPNSNEMEAMRASVNFETQTFIGAQSKDQYVTNIKQKLIMMTTARQQQLQQMQGNLGQQNNPINAMNSAQMNMMGQPGAQGIRQGTPQQFNPAFPNAHLQRPMQVSGVPNMAQGQPSIGINSGNPAALNQGQGAQQPNMQQQAQARQDAMIINQFAKRLMDSCKEEVRQKFQQDVQSWPDDKKQQLLNQGMNPLFFRFRQHAEMLYKRGTLNLQQNPGGNMNQMAQPGQLNRMQSEQMGLNQRQPNQGFDFNAITNQQMEAMRVQDQGATVVPASNNMNAQQFNGLPGQNQQQMQQQNAAMAQRQAMGAAYQNNMQNNMQRQHVQQMQQHAQAQHQAQAQLEQQRQLQAQARNGNQPLQGINGGLNLPPNSTASPNPMSMLNRPMVPPGQPAPPATPQQQPQNHVPVMAPRPGQVTDQQPQGNALMREAQARANTMAQSNQPLTEHVRMSMMPADMEPHVKMQMLKLPELQFRQALQNYMVNIRRNNAMQPTLFPGGPQGQGQPNMLFNQQQPGMQVQMMGNPNMAGMGRPGANFGQQIPRPGQQPVMGQRPVPQSQQQRLQAAQALLTQNPGIIPTTDTKPFPPGVLNDQIRSHLPPEVRTWHDLKQFASRNPALIPGIDVHKLTLLQVLHFQDLVKQAQSGQAGVPTPQQNKMAGAAPAAHATPNQGPLRTLQQQQNISNMPPIQVSPQEMQVARSKLPPHQQGATDEQLRQFIVAHKMKVRQQSQQHQTNQQQLLAQQRAAQQPQPMLGQQHHQQQHQQQQQQQQPNRPPPAQSQTAPAASQPKATARSNPPSQPTQPNTANIAGKGVKRPNEDMVDSIGDGQAMVPTRSGPGPNLTQEQMSKLTPAQQAQMKAQLLKAQDASNAANNKMQQQQQRAMPTQDELKNRLADPNRARALKQMIDEVENSLPPRQIVQLSSQLRGQLQHTLKGYLGELKKVESALRVFHASYDGADSENFVRQMAKARALVFSQIDEKDGTLHDRINLTPDEFKQHMRSMLGFVKRFTSKGSEQANQPSAQQPQAGDASSGPTAQLNAANLKIVEQQQRNQKAPSAPTTDRPPFALGDQAAHGAPTYFDGAKTVTNLVLPDKKRTKLDPGSQTSTPGPKPSPRIGTGKGSSPELTRQPPPEKQVPQKPTFRCKAGDCEYSVRGFDSQVELDSHVDQMHNVIENPLHFALESMAEFLNVDQRTGEPRVDPSAAKPAAKPAPAAPRALPSVKSEHTPNVLHNASTPAGAHAAATPMTRIPTQPGMKSSPATTLLKTPQTMAKVATPTSGSHAKATPTSMPRPAPKDIQQPAAEPPMKEEEQPLLPMSLLDYSYEDTFATLDANGPFSVLDLKDEDNTWAIRSRPASPMTTPDSSAKDTPSTRTSDISENDNLQISVDMDMPDAWAMGLYADALPFNMRLSDDMQNLGVVLPDMDSDDMMLFPTYGNGMMDLEAMEKTMDQMASLDPSLFDTA